MTLPRGYYEKRGSKSNFSWGRNLKTLYRPGDQGQEQPSCRVCMLDLS